MSDEIIVCTDGSDPASHAAAEGLKILTAADHVVLTTVIDPVDPTLVTGTGFAGGTMSPEELETYQSASKAAARGLLEELATKLGLGGAELIVLEGHSGDAVCRLASERDARAIVMGSRGRGGVRRALLGSVSDHVVRNAPCPVVITGPADA
jgi:nucleotide-binding universal stress UspA family protein